MRNEGRAAAATPTAVTTGAFVSLALCAIVATSACAQLIDIQDVSRAPHVGGSVTGLWEGSDGVALRLEADGVNALLTVPADGPFSFPKQLPLGTSYTVTVATNPRHHSCTIDAGGNGTIERAEVKVVAVLCSGPAVDIDLSPGWRWSFDPPHATQKVAGSVASQEVAVRVTGSLLTGALVGGIPATLGMTTTPITVPLGVTTVPVALTAQGGLSRTYALELYRGAAVLEQVVYGKASNTGTSDRFGYTVALSGDTLVVGAPYEASAATGVNGDQIDNSASQAGAVYVFVHSDAAWTQQAYLKASNTGAGDYFGSALALSGDTLVVGAYREASAATGVNGNQADNTASRAGAVYVFVRAGTTWAQQAYLKASNTGADDLFGAALALSGDTLVVGAYREASAATGVNGNQADNTAIDAGAIYVFVRSGAAWAQQAYLKASNSGAGDVFGASLALSGDTLVVGAAGEASAATGVNGNQADNTASGAGAIYVFVRAGAAWTQQAYLKASNTGAADRFGNSLALSGDTLVVGADSEDSAATGVHGNQANNTATDAGVVYVFVRSGTAWAQQAYLKASNTGASDFFGYSLALSGDTLVVGAYGEASAATSFNGNQADNSAGEAGAVYIFR